MLSDVTVVEPGVGAQVHRDIAVDKGIVVDVRPTTTSSDHLAHFAGMYVLPGITDLHVHFPPAWALGQRELFSLLFLMHGVTSVRDLGSVGLAPDIAGPRPVTEDYPAPRVFSCGVVVDGPGGTWPGARVVRTPREARSAVDEIASQGARCIKVYSSLGLEPLREVHRRAHELGIRVVGHLPRSVPWNSILIDEVQHICDPRCLGLDAKATNALVAAAIDGPIDHLPTFVVYDRQVGSPEIPQEALLLPRFWRDIIWRPEFGIVDGSGIGRDSAFSYRSSVLRALKQLRAGRVQLLIGSDPINPWVVPGWATCEEMRLFVREIGYSPTEVWTLVTRTAATVLREDRLGSVRPGAYADLAIYRQDPTRDLSALETLEAVIVDGRMYRREDLEYRLGRIKTHFESPVVDAMSITFSRLIALVAPALVN